MATTQPIQPKVSKEVVLEDLKKMVEDSEWKLRKNLSRLSPKNRRALQFSIDFYKSVIHHLEN